MSDSLSGTLNGGDGGPPPRPFIQATIGDCNAIQFELSTTQTLGSINGNPYQGTASFSVDSESMPGPGGIGVGVIFDGYSSPPGTFTITASGGVGGTLTSGNPVFYASVTYEIGAEVTMGCSGTVVRQKIVDSPSGPVAIGRVTIDIGNGPCVWDNVVLGPGDAQLDGGYVQQSIQAGTFFGNIGEITDLLGTLQLDPLTPHILENLALTGENLYVLATALEYQMDSIYGPWLPVDSFAAGYSWAGTGPTAIAGVHWIRVRDANNPTVVSNIQSYYLSAITLNLIGAVANVAPAIGGYDYESSVAATLQLQMNGQGDWLDIGEYVAASAPDGAWTGLGLPEPPGAYTAQARNPTTGNLSNIVEYVITQNGGSYPTYPIWSVQPDWSNGMLERLEWLTGVLQSESGAEQRLKLRLSPRRTFQMQTIIFGRERALYDLALKAQGSSNWYVPNWTDVVRLTDVLKAGASPSSFAVETAGHEYFAGGLLILYGSAFSYEIVVIGAVTDDAVVLAAAPLADWPFGTRVMPLLLANLSEEPTAARYADRALVGTVSFTTQGPTDYPANLTGLDTYNGFPVLTLGPDEGASLNYKFERLKYDLDPTIGLRLVADTAGFGFGSQQYAWFVNGYDQVAQLRGLLYALAGKLNPLWVPTFYADLDLVEDIGAEDTAITVGQCGYTLFACSTLSGRNNIRIELYDTTSIYAAITASAVDGDDEVLQLDSALGVDVPMASVKRISFMALCRQDADQIEFDHKAAGGVATVTTIFREAPDIRQLVFNILDPAKTTSGYLSESGAYYRIDANAEGGVSKSVLGLTAGKYWVECGINSPTDGGIDGFGVTLIGTNPGQVTYNAQSSAMLYNNSYVFVNNYQQAILGGSDETPAYYGMAVDLDNDMIWFITSYDQSTPIFNNNTAADPSQNIGGFDISFRDGAALYLVVCFQPTSDQGANAFVNAGQVKPFLDPPTGFLQAWAES